MSDSCLCWASLNGSTCYPFGKWQEWRIKFLHKQGNHSSSIFSGSRQCNRSSVSVSSSKDKVKYQPIHWSLWDPCSLIHSASPPFTLFPGSVLPLAQWETPHTFKDLTNLLSHTLIFWFKFFFYCKAWEESFKCIYIGDVTWLYVEAVNSKNVEDVLSENQGDDPR